MEHWILDHRRRNFLAVLLDLGSNVAEESVARPSAEKHDRCDWDVIQVHSHCGGGSNRVKANVVWVEAICLIGKGADEDLEVGRACC